MKLLLLFYLIIPFLDTIPKKIIINPNQVDKINATDFADTILAIHLKISETRLKSVDKVYLAGQNIFILGILKENDIIDSYVFRFDLSGNFKGQIGEKDQISKKFQRIFDMKYDETDEHIYLAYSDGYRVYNPQGELLSFYKGNGNLAGSRAPREFIFHNQIWGTEYSTENGDPRMNLVCSDLKGEKTAIIKSFDNGGSKIFSLGSFSIQNNQLYYSSGMDNILCRVAQDKLYSKFKTEIKDVSISNSHLNLTQVLIGSFLKTGYWYKGISCDQLYNIKTNKSFNIRYNYQNKILISGVNDNFYNTGFFSINPTNRENCLYFIRQPEEIKKSKLFDQELSNPVLFLVKLK